MTTKLDRLDQRILDQNRIDTALLIKNDRIGKTARPRVNVVKKNITGVDEELLKEYQQMKPQSYEYIDESGDKKYRKYILPDSSPPDLEQVEPDITKQQLDIELRRIEDEKMTHLALLERAKENLKKNQNYQRQIRTLINNQEVLVGDDKDRMMFMLEDYLQGEQALKQYINQLHDMIYQEDAQKSIVKDTFFNINSERQKKRQTNLERINMYRDELNFLNKGAFSTEKADNESEMEYLERLQRNAEIQSPEDQLTDAKALTITRFREKMRELVKDPVLIEQVINTLDSNSDENVDDKANLLKNWNLLKTKFISTYGVNNKRLTASDIITFFDFFLESGESGLSKAVEGLINVPAISSSGIANNIEIQQLSSEDMLLVIAHTAGGDKFLFLRSVNDGSKNHLLYSFDGNVGTFKEFFDDKLPYNRKSSAGGTGTSSKEIEKYTGITPEQFNSIFDIKQKKINPNMIATKLSTKYGIRSVSVAEESRADIFKTKYATSKNEKPTKIEYGMGLPAEDIPQYVNFGNVILLLQKLYYHNQLSVKNKQLKSVAGFRTTRVSEGFVKLITNMLKGLQPSHSDITSLSNSERQLYDRLIQVANLNKTVAHQGDKTISDLKHRLKMIEGEISMGNNNPMLKKELYAVLHSLKNFKVITQSQINNYMKQFA